jgi:hypothetical protein
MLSIWSSKEIFDEGKLALLQAQLSSNNVNQSPSRHQSSSAGGVNSGLWQAKTMTPMLPPHQGSVTSSPAPIPPFNGHQHQQFPPPTVPLQAPPMMMMMTNPMNRPPFMPMQVATHQPQFPAPHQLQPQMIPTALQVPPPVQKKYFELPAGLMVPCLPVSGFFFFFLNEISNLF